MRKKDKRSGGRKRVIRKEEVEPSKVESELEVSWDKRIGSCIRLLVGRESEVFEKKGITFQQNCNWSTFRIGFKTF